MYMSVAIRQPVLEEKLDALTTAAKHDVCLASCASNSSGGVGRLRDPDNPLQRWIYPATVPGKGQVGILKVLQTTSCKNNCSYCRLAVKNDSTRRLSFTATELSDIFMRFYRAKMVHGIFLSSGLGMSADTAMQQMIDTAEILRNRYNFREYIHLKVLPGVSFSLVESAARYADRLSINLETPRREQLSRIAPDKQFATDIVLRMKWVGDLLSTDTHVKSQTTQFVVGAAGETDLDIIKTTDYVYKEYRVFRAYFSALQNERSDPDSLRIGEDKLRREHRLYQSDFLLRGYGFRLHDLVFNTGGNLPGSVDPKTAYALMHQQLYPIDINSAEETELLKVPGIGPTAAKRIIATRTLNPFRNIAELKRTGAWTARAAGYVEFSGKKDPDDEQGWLFDRLAPSDWRTGLSAFSTKGEETDTRYDGQRDKHIYYEGPYGPSRKGPKILCRG